MGVRPNTQDKRAVFAVVMTRHHPPAALQTPPISFSCKDVIGLASNSLPLTIWGIFPLHNVHLLLMCQVRLLKKYLLT